MKFGIKRLLVKCLFTVNTGIVLLCILSAYSGHVSPADFKYVSCVPMMFPIFLVLTVVAGIVTLLFKPMYATMQLFCFVVCFQQIKSVLPLNLSSEPTAEERKDYIKILSYNTCGFNDPEGNDSTNAVIDYIVASDADIVCLQESNLEDNNKYGKLKKKFEVYPYQTEMLVGDTIHIKNGLACFSRYPIVYINKVVYPAEGNGTLVYKLLIDGDTVAIVNNHFESNRLTPEEKTTYKNIIKEHDVNTMPGDSKMIIGKLSNASARRAVQVDAVAEVIDTLRTKYPLIVCGDFNDPPISYTHNRISENLTDCHTAAGKGPGISYNQRGFFFRIDNIMINDKWDVKYCKVDNSISKSDHNPIFAYLKIRK